jgi:hypothetical protein
MVREASCKTLAVTLTDGTTHRISKVLSVPHNTAIVPTAQVAAQLEKNVIKVATQQHKGKQLYKRENIKATDVVEGGRSARAGLGVM